MKPPCEIVVKRILPTIRAILVKDMKERHGLTQTEIANKLGVTQPAVSQYLKSARGEKELEEELKKTGLYKRFQELTDQIKSGSIQKNQIIERYCELCDSMGKAKILCTLHRENVSF